MSDEINDIFYGRTKKVKLADGNEYTLREPDLLSIKEAGLNINEFAKVDILDWVFLMIKDSHKDITKKKVGRLITTTMLLSEDSNFIAAFMEILGIGTSSKKK